MSNACIALSKVDKIGENSFFVPKEFTAGKKVIKIAGETYKYFRDKIYLGCNPCDLSLGEIIKINEICDGDECKANILAKKLIAGALSGVFSDSAFRVYDIGCGKHTIEPYIDSKSFKSCVGIDEDPAAVQSVISYGGEALNWNDLIRNPLPRDVSSIATAVYSMHFLAKESVLPQKIKHIIGDNGLFVGNLYQDPNEHRGGKCSQYLKGVFQRANLDYHVVADRNKSNEYWVVGNRNDSYRLEEVSNHLKTHI